MKKNELRELLSKTDNRFSVFADIEILKKCEMTFIELIDIIDEFLNDEEKAKLFELSHFKTLKPTIRKNIAEKIKDDTLKLRLLLSEDFIKGMESYNIESMVMSLGENGRIKILRDNDFWKSNNLSIHSRSKIVIGLGDIEKQKVLQDKKFATEELQLNKWQIKDLVASLSDETNKKELIDFYEFQENDTIDILKTFSDSGKRDILLNKRYPFRSTNSIKTLVGSFSVNEMIRFFKEQRQFLRDNEIKIYQITKNMKKEDQIEIVAQLENMNLSSKEKKLILATLSEETKKEINQQNLGQEYLNALSVTVFNDISDIYNYGNVIIDFDSNLERYRDLDDLISINPKEFGEDERKKFLMLCEICPSLNIIDDLNCGVSTTQEYKTGENWIDSILSKIDDQWTEVQKLAYIHYAIGKKMSYSPDFDTEVSNEKDARALWKIISSGYGVCNGIAQIEQYMLKKVGIISKVVSSGTHAFLKIEDIELPTKDGKTVRGSTIVDPTWDLAASRYDGRPNNFCRSYEEIRKSDINSEGEDSECHKNDEELLDATLNLDDESLRKIFTSIGIAYKDGNFKIKELIDKSQKIDSLNLAPEKSIEMQLQLLSRYYPQFATCQNSTLTILQGISLGQDNLRLEKCVASRVYERRDDKKQPIIYVYAVLPTMVKKFYFANKQLGEFEGLSPEQFVSRFECYDMDIEKQGGVRPWETDSRENVESDLSRSSGKIIADENEK